MKTQNSQEPPPVSAWMEDALAMMELSAEVTAALAAAAGNDDPLKYFPGYAEAAEESDNAEFACSDGLAELEAERTKYVAEALNAEAGSANESFWLYHIAMIDMALEMKRGHSANK